MLSRSGGVKRRQFLWMFIGSVARLAKSFGNFSLLGPDRRDNLL